MEENLTNHTYVFQLPISILGGVGSWPSVGRRRPRSRPRRLKTRQDGVGADVSVERSILSSTIFLRDRASMKQSNPRLSCFGHCMPWCETIYLASLITCCSGHQPFSLFFAEEIRSRPAQDRASQVVYLRLLIFNPCQCWIN